MTFKIGFIVAAIATLATAPIASAHNTGFAHGHQQSNNSGQFLGGALGAVLGGVAGSQLARPGDRTEGSVIGAVLGGVAGAALTGNGNNGFNSGSNGGYYNRGGG